MVKIIIDKGRDLGQDEFVLIQEQLPDRLKYYYDCNEAIIDRIIAIKKKRGTLRCPAPDCKSKNVYRRLDDSKDLHKLWCCKKCWKSFSICRDTIFENSPIDMIKWIYVLNVYTHGKKEFTKASIAKKIGVTYPTAKAMLSKLNEFRLDESKSRDMYLLVSRLK